MGSRLGLSFLWLASQQITRVVLLPVPLLFSWALHDPSLSLCCKLGLQACAQQPTELAEAPERAWPNGTLMNSRPAGLARRSGLGLCKKEKAENWPLVGEAYAGPIASDKQVLGELCAFS